MKTYFTLLLLSIVALIAGCSNGSTTSPSAQALDAAVAVASAPVASVLPPHTLLDAPEQPVAPPPPKVDTRTPAQKAADELRNINNACRSPDGIWRCPKIKQTPMLMASSGNATAAQCGPACLVGAWYFDPANGTGCASDGNSGTSATCGAAGSGIGPLSTFAQIVTRLGSTIPQYPPGQSVAVTQLSAQAANTDVIFFEPHLSNGGQAILTVVPVAVGAPQTITVSTSLSRGAPGTLLTLTNPVGVAAKQLIIDTTRSSQAIVDSVGATTVMQTPQTSASLNSTAVVPAPVEDVAPGWQTGDTAQLYTLQNTNLKSWNPLGGDLSSAGVPSGGWVFTASIADPDPSNLSAFKLQARSAVNAMVNCVINPLLYLGSEGARTRGAYLLGCSVLGAQTLAFAGQCGIYGGGMTALQTFPGFASVLNDAILHGNSVFAARCALNSAYCDGSFAVKGATVDVGGIIWGSYGVVLDVGGFWWNDGGSTFTLAALLTSGALTINGHGTGYSFTAATGLWGTGTALTPAAIDAAAGASLYAQGGSGGFVTQGY